MMVRVDKKELIIERAVGLFATNGYYKTTTAQVASAAGVTQPYVFHFFKNKEELFNAVLDRATTRLFDIFESIEAPADQLHREMGKAFMQMMESHRDEIMMIMQSHAINEPLIRECVRSKFDYIHRTLGAKFERAGLPNAKAAAENFIADGLLITLSEVLGLPNMRKEKLKHK
jgi:AcrR family transcriptional regulator